MLANIKLYYMVTNHRKNDFAEGSKILLDTDLKIILSDQNNFVGILKIISCKQF